MKINVLCEFSFALYSELLKGVKACISPNGTPMTELQDLTCHTGSHSVTCYPRQTNAPRLNPSPQAGTWVVRFQYEKTGKYAQFSENRPAMGLQRGRVREHPDS